ncbi:MAG TPA: carboxypeptidase-like regulatory domain-containing protein [Bacteroidia bacterium]|nr:carboxypeptidase-like regulatory domain-containing protein [Bacteroidia bacterium]
MKKVFCTIFIFYSFIAFSQKRITGTVTDSLKNETVPFASIGLLSLPDSIIVKGTITDEKGNFSLDGVRTGNYAVKISAVGYLDHIIGTIRFDSSSSDRINLQTSLSTSSHTFNEIAVTAIKRTVEFKNNNIIVNVEDSPLSKGNSVFDLLPKIPGVSVENDEIKIQGKQGVVVMIDDRPQNLSPQQLANMLRGMPADLLLSGGKPWFGARVCKQRRVVL